MKLPPRRAPDAPLSLCEHCLVVDFFFELLAPFLPPSFSHLSCHLSFTNTPGLWFNNSTGTNKFTVDCFYFLSSIPPRSSGDASKKWKHSRELIEPQRIFSAERHHSFQQAIAVRPAIFNKKPTAHRQLCLSLSFSSPRGGFLEQRRVSRDKSSEHWTAARKKCVWKSLAQLYRRTIGSRYQYSLDQRNGENDGVRT